MTIPQVINLGQSAQIDSLTGWLLIGLGCVGFFMVLYCITIDLMERSQVEAQRERLREELAMRFKSRERQAQTGEWRSEGAGKANERGDW